jgi:acyl phosphate:glycerol-3-phosphate acyltransferase
MDYLLSPYGLLALIFGYLLGSIPFGLLLTRAAGLDDLRKIGSGNIGATNVLRTGHKGLAAATLLLDALKGMIAVLIVDDIARRFVSVEALSQVHVYAYIAGLGAFLGHIYPVWLGFRGGKGVATYIGVLIGVHGLGALVFCLIWALVAAATRYSSLAALTATVGVVLYYLVTGWAGWAGLQFILIISALIFLKHGANIRRLLERQETKIGERA